ncbi:MAG: transcriptional repressor [Myxococcales bacterium]|nr:transcriptional repressor [Myxococcales bacterium]MCB9629815.1 transcriptional repressor [Sandaracinaceae bacterium]
MSGRAHEPATERLSKDEARQRVQATGLRATAPRVAVYQLLLETERPLSHSEVVAQLASPDWDQATIYRNLLKLVEANLAWVASHVGGVARYEARREHDEPHYHPHFSCRSCGAVECLPEARLAAAVDKRWREAVAEAELQLVGECPTCRAAPSFTR